MPAESLWATTGTLCAHPTLKPPTPNPSRGWLRELQSIAIPASGRHHGPPCKRESPPHATGLTSAIVDNETRTSWERGLWWTCSWCAKLA
eukprot:5694703-Amphidinium_carterae.3